jgi:hypothetical protein
MIPTVFLAGMKVDRCCPDGAGRPFCQRPWPQDPPPRVQADAFNLYTHQTVWSAPYQNGLGGLRRPTGAPFSALGRPRAGAMGGAKKWCTQELDALADMIIELQPRDAGHGTRQPMWMWT